MIASIRRDLRTYKFLVPVGVLLWLLICLAFTLMVRPADAYSSTTGCPSDKTEAMDGVWSGSTRLRIINLCQSGSATMNYAEIWPGDSDNNLYVTADTSLQSNRKGIQNIQSWCEAQDTASMYQNDPTNPCIQPGGDGSSPQQPAHAASNMNWEIIPRDQCTLQVADRTVGPQQISAHGVLVRDKWHGYNEIHPITELNGTVRSSSGC